MNALQTIFSLRLKFPKAAENYVVLNFFGKNILTADFDEWKRHRKIAAPAFSEVRDDRQGIIPCVEPFPVEKHQTRLRGVRESYYLAV